MDVRTVMAVIVLAFVGIYALGFLFLLGMAYQWAETLCFVVLPYAAVIGLVGWSVWWLL